MLVCLLQYTTLEWRVPVDCEHHYRPIWHMNIVHSGLVLSAQGGQNALAFVFSTVYRQHQPPRASYVHESQTLAAKVTPFCGQRCHLEGITYRHHCHFTLWCVPQPTETNLSRARQVKQPMPPTHTFVAPWHLCAQQSISPTTALLAHLPTGTLHTQVSTAL